MRRVLAAMALPLLLATACSDRTTAPATVADETLEQVIASASPAANMIASGVPATMRGLGALPPALRLTREQQATIRALLEAHGAALETDRAALRAVMEEVAAARHSGKTQAEIAAIMSKAAPIMERIAAAHAALEVELVAVLTPAQRDWLASYTKRCDLAAMRLTAAQRAQVDSLRHAFEAANRADLDLVASAMTQARAAHAAGASRTEIQAILRTAAPAFERLAAARAELQARINALLSDEQRNCR
jgi:hypothetical protein